RETVDGNPGPLCKNLGDLFFPDDPAGLTGQGLEGGTFAEQTPLLVAQCDGTFVVLTTDGIGLVPTHRTESAVDPGDLGVVAGPVDTHPATGLVDEVDGLVGKETIGDVPVGEIGRGHDRLLGEPDR